MCLYPLFPSHDRQKKKVTYIDFIAPNTIDEKIRKALRKKINIASKVMGEELKQWI